MQIPPNEHNNFSLSRFESMLKTNSVLFFDSEEFEDIIQHYLENGKIALAKKATKLGLEQHPTSTNLKLFQVEMYIFENKLDIADQLLDELHVLEQSNEEIYIQKANILSRRDKHKDAIRLLEQALEVTNDESDVLSLIGMEYLFLEDFENAKYFFMKCLEEDEEDYSALYNIIYCFEYLEQHEAAIDYLNDFLNKNPYCEVAWHQVGKQYYFLKDYKKALAAFDFAIISDDRFIGAYLEKGKVLEKLKQYKEAIESYSITLGLDDPTSFALLRIGKCYEKLGDPELALQFYSKCVEEDALLDKGWIAITDYYIKNKNYKKALYYIDKALNIDSENVLYWKRYAKINTRLKLYEEAEHGFRRTLELGNYELETWLMRCDILIQLGEYEAAVKNLFQASEFYPENAEIEFRLAGLYYFLTEDRKAEFHLKNGLKFDPEFSMIIEELFPTVYLRNSVKEIIKKHKNPSV
ncbi:MAG: tetratricopeptide repeat protein [Flavobacteriales bacterium]|jgi:tetratricopeptide (TPR) repeat protein|uniref:tetratricopeptide repeat protein n=1 Tax=Candidatus Ulvibacter alkanivorans TaxID=2267620 RepID=UPI000DF30401|nr:tetratricopeptide repeat protein [Candidatus Ulvibacter alkanivorans]MCH2490918.1 tetratricopeptide repeat protein [Flavobacteriales bacterium]